MKSTLSTSKLLTQSLPTLPVLPSKIKHDSSSLSPSSEQNLLPLFSYPEFTSKKDSREKLELQIQRDGIITEEIQWENQNSFLKDLSYEDLIPFFENIEISKDINQNEIFCAYHPTFFYVLHSMTATIMNAKFRCLRSLKQLDEFSMKIHRFTKPCEVKPHFRYQIACYYIYHENEMIDRINSFSNLLKETTTFVIWIESYNPNKIVSKIDKLCIVENIVQRNAKKEIEQQLSKTKIVSNIYIGNLLLELPINNEEKKITPRIIISSENDILSEKSSSSEKLNSRKRDSTSYEHLRDRKSPPKRKDSNPTRTRSEFVDDNKKPHRMSKKGKSVDSDGNPRSAFASLTNSDSSVKTLCSNSRESSPRIEDDIKKI